MRTFTQEELEKLEVELISNAKPDSKLHIVPSKYYIKQGVIYHEGKIVVSKEQVPKILGVEYQNPSTMWMSPDKFYSSLSRKYYGITLDMVKSFLSKQQVSQIYKNEQKKEVQAIRTNAPRQMFVIDTFSMEAKKEKLPYYNNGFRHVLLVMDHYSKYAWGFALKNIKQGTDPEKYDVKEVKTAKLTKEGEQTIASTLDRFIFSQGEIPKTLYGDNAFRNQYIEEVAMKYQFTTMHNVPRRPIGAIERFVRTIKEKLYEYMKVNKTREWSKVLPEIIENYNYTKHSAHKHTPYLIHFTKDPKVLEKARIRTESYRKWKIMKKSKLGPLSKGDVVRILLKRTPEGAHDRQHKPKGYVGRWSEELFVVEKRYIGKSDNQLDWYLTSYRNGNIRQLFKRSELQLVKEVENQILPKYEVPEERGFSREKHLVKIHKKGRQRPIYVKPKTAAEERKENPTKRKQTDFLRFDRGAKRVKFFDETVGDTFYQDSKV